MPKTKLESIVFTAITAWMMVYLMTLYNIVLASGTFVNATFLTALKTMWVEFVLIFLCAYFLSSRVAKHFAFQVVKPTDRPIAIIFAIQTFTVVSQVALASILGVYHGYGFTAQFVPGLPDDLLPEFHHGAAVAAVPGGSHRPEAVPDAVPAGEWAGREKSGARAAARGDCGVNGTIFLLEPAEILKDRHFL